MKAATPPPMMVRSLIASRSGGTLGEIGLAASDCAYGHAVELGVPDDVVLDDVEGGNTTDENPGGSFTRQHLASTW